MRARFVAVLTPMAALVAALSLVACTDPNVGPTVATDRISPELAPAAGVLQVAEVEQLYAAVNDPKNEGAAITLAPGAYMLSATNAAGVARPNGGRLELQRDMSLYGVADRRAAVVVDGSRLPVSSLRVALGSMVVPTAPIRVGRGTNTAEWLTVLGSPTAVASIATDLAGTATTRIRIAHVVATGASRGVDVRNVGTSMAGRAIHAEIVDGDFSRGIVGIRIANFASADRGDIDVITSGNRSYMNIQGCAVENNLTSFATITVRSNGDRFEDNGIGCQLGGGFVGMSTGAANSNTTVFEAHGSEFSNNTRTEFFNTAGAPTFTEFGGVLVAGGHAVASPNTTSNNTVTVRLWGCKVSGNQDVDFEALGALSGTPSGIAGTNNRVTIELHGVSKRIDVQATASQPVDPTGTNAVTVIR